MYRIINVADGSVIGVTENPFYFKKKISGSWQNQGILYKGKTYNLQDRKGIGADITVRLDPFDAGIHLDQTDAAIDDIIIAMLEG